MKNGLWVLLSLLVGMVLGGLGPRADLRQASEEIACLKQQAHARTGNAGLSGITSMLRIPVSMHNLTDDQLFRPTAWSAFGAMDPQGADFRACANFGPVYGKF